MGIELAAHIGGDRIDRDQANLTDLGDHTLQLVEILR
jgi:hypothetical protein